MRNRGPDATLYDIGKYDMIIARCVCGHKAPVRPSVVPKSVSVQTRIRDLPRYLRCEVCGVKGQASVRVMTR